MKGNFQARFWNSGGRGDSPADCSKLSEVELYAIGTSTPLESNKSHGLCHRPPVPRGPRACRPRRRPLAYASAAGRGAGTGVCCMSPAWSMYCHIVVPSCGVPAIRIGFAPARGTTVRSARCS